MPEPVQREGLEACAPPPELAGTLQELAQAFLTLEHSFSFYPEGHQSRRAPLAHLLGLMRVETEPGGEGSLGFAGETLLWRGRLYNELPAGVRKLALLLGSRGITRVVWAKELTIETLGRFFELLVRSRAAGHRQTWDTPGLFEHLRVEGLDYQALMTQSGAQTDAQGRQDLWNALLLRLFANPAPEPSAPELDLLRGDWGDPAVLATQLAAAIGQGAETGETPAVESVRRFAALIERAAASGAAQPEGEGPEKLGAVTRQLPPDLQLSLLEAALAEPAASTFARACGALNPQQGVTLLGRTFKMDAAQIARLARVFQHLVPRRLDRMELAPQVREEIRRAGDPDDPLADNAWEEVQELLTGEAGEFMSPEYQQQLRQLADRAEARRGAEASFADLGELVSDLAPVRMAEESLQIQLEQLRLATSVERYRDALEGVGGLCVASLAAGDRERGVLILRRLLELSAGAEPLAGPRPEIERTVRALSTKPLLQALVPLVHRLSTEDQAAVHTLFSLANEEASPVLLDALVAAEDTEQRRQVEMLLLGLGSTALPEILQRLAAAPPAVARALLPLIAGLRDPAAVPALLGLLGREDQKLRRDTLRVLLKIDSAEVHRALPRLLDDRDQEIVQMAATHLGTVGSPETVRALLRAFDGGLFTGRRAKEMQRAIFVLGRMRASEAVAPLSELLHRRTWINRRTREELSEAAAQALARIGGAEARLALEQGAARGTGGLVATCRRLLARWGSE